MERCKAVQVGMGFRHRRLRESVSHLALTFGVCAFACAGSAAGTTIGSGSTTQLSKLGGASVELNGGTLQIDSSTTYSHDITLDAVTSGTNTIDVDGSTTILSGKFTGSGNVTFSNSASGGVLTLTNSANDYTGTTTINSGVTLALLDSNTTSDTNTDSGSIAHSQRLVNNGIFDISGTVSGATLISLSGSGNIVLGGQTLVLNNYDSTNSKTYDTNTTFSGVISGKGNLVLSSGTITLTGANTYTGYTSISTGTLTLAGAGSISGSGDVVVGGTLDVSQTSGSSTSIKSLNGGGSVVLGAQTLAITAAAGSFTGIISGTGNLVMTGGTQFLAGANTFSGGITVSGGTLEMGSGVIAYNIANTATFAFDSASSIAMSGVVSGTGTVENIGAGTTTITAVQTYTGPTLVNAGTISLSGAGSIAASSAVTVNGAFDISGTSGTAITSLAGTGTVKLANQTLTITNGAGVFSGTIGGTGGLILAGGTQSLSGANTYSGPTVVNAGLLKLLAGTTLTSAVTDNAALDISAGSSIVSSGNSTVKSLGGNGTVALGGNSLVLSYAGDTFSGTISGAGGLWLNGGTETLSGANTYTGATTIAGGTLALSATGSLSSSSAVVDYGTFDVSAAAGPTITFASLSGSGTVKLGALTLNLANAAGTFSGAISGTGGLVVSGGTEILSGTNTYTGGTTIASGSTLQIGSNLANGAIVGNVVDNGTLAFGESGTTVFSATVSGSGALAQNGSGTTMLTAANSYTGGTTIAKGTLQIGNGTAFGSIVGDVTDNGTLAFGRSDSFTYTGVISGTGTVSAVSGITTLSTANTYTGTTSIASGATLALSGSGSIASSSGLTANGTFDVSAAASPLVASLGGAGKVALGSKTLTVAAANGTFSGVVAGSGGLAVTGGAQTLSGISTYTGATTVSGASLAVNGSIASSSGVAIASGGKLAGSGAVSALTVNSGATLEPGTAGSGVLTVTGGVTMASGSKLVVDLSSASVASLTATGSANLGGTLSAVSTDGTYALGQKLTAVTAGGGITVTDASATITAGNGAQFTSSFTHDATHLFVEVDLSKLAPVLSSGSSANAVAVVGGIDKAIAAGNKLTATFQDLGNDSSAELATDASHLAGEIGGDVTTVTRSLFAPFVDAMFDHLDARHPPAKERTLDVWMAGVGSTNIVAADTASGAHRFRTSVVGLAGGALWALAPNLTVGGAVSAETSQFRLAGDFGKGNATAFQAGLYGQYWMSRHFYTSFALATSVAAIKTKRVLTVSGTDDLNGKMTATTFGGRLETGVLLYLLEPFIAYQGQLSTLPSYTETASAGTNTFALHYASRTVNDGRVELGFRQDYVDRFKPHWIVTPDFDLHLTDKLAWGHDLSGRAQSDASFASLAASGFTVYGAKSAKEMVLASAGVDIRFDGGLTVSSHVDTAFTERSQAFTGMFGVDYQW